MSASCKARGGRVLEIGAGTGHKPAVLRRTVAAITVTEPEAPMARRLERSIREQPRHVELIHAPAEQLPFADEQFDTIVSTLVLYTVDDQARVRNPHAEGFYVSCGFRERDRRDSIWSGPRHADGVVALDMRPAC